MYPKTVCNHVSAGGTFTYLGEGHPGSVRVCNVCHYAEESFNPVASAPHYIQWRALLPADGGRKPERMKRQLEL